MKKEQLEDVGYLYIMKDVKYNTGWYKVGKTKDPIVRLQKYNSSFPEDRLVYAFLSEKMYNISELERTLIETIKIRFRVHNKRYEWFKHTSCYSGFASEIIKIIEGFYDTYYEIE